MEACVWTTCPGLLHNNIIKGSQTHDLMIASPVHEPLYYHAKHHAYQNSQKMKFKKK